MRLDHHFFSGIVFVILLYFLFYPIIFVLELLIIFLSSFLIDVDHYLYYVVKKRDFSLRRAYKWYIKNTRSFCSLPLDKRKKFYLGLYVFHGIEPLIILFLLGFYLSSFFYFIFVGFFFHISSDLIFEIVFKQRIDKISIIQNFLATKRLTNFEEVDFEKI